MLKNTADVENPAPPQLCSTQQIMGGINNYQLVEDVKHWHYSTVWLVWLCWHGMLQTKHLAASCSGEIAQAFQDVFRWRSAKQPFLSAFFIYIIFRYAHSIEIYVLLYTVHKAIPVVAKVSRLT